MNFGYLPQTDLETGNLRTDDQLRDAIKNLQVSGAFHGIVFDNERSTPKRASNSGYERSTVVN